MEEYDAIVNIEHDGRELTAFATLDQIHFQGRDGEEAISERDHVDKIEVQDSATGEVIDPTEEIRIKVANALQREYGITAHPDPIDHIHSKLEVWQDGEKIRDIS